MGWPWKGQYDHGEGEKERNRGLMEWNEAGQMNEFQTGVLACVGSSIDGWHKGDGEREEMKREFGAMDALLMNI